MTALYEKVVTDYYIRVEISDGFNYEFEKIIQYKLKVSNSVIKDIERHVDDIHYATLIEESEYRCPFCNREIILIKDYIPNCCDAAIDIWELENNRIHPNYEHDDN